MAQKQVAWNSGAGYIKLTYTGHGNGSIIVDSDENNLGTARSQVVTVHTVDGTKSVNLTVRQGANPFPVGKVQDFSYTGDYEEIELPAGTYKLQCWGAQGGTNGINSTYGITAKAGGKGGYSEGVLTLSQKTVIRAYVGGQGTATSGGFNGGGDSPGESQLNSDNEFGVTKMAGGGGATDFRLGDGSLYSRMIVAGGGAGGSMSMQEITTSEYQDQFKFTVPREYHLDGSMHLYGYLNAATDLQFGKTYKLVAEAGYSGQYIIIQRDSNNVWKAQVNVNSGEYFSTERASGATKICWVFLADQKYGDILYTDVYEKVSVPVTTRNYNYQDGYAGGGVNGKGGTYSSYKYYGQQNVAGQGGTFGQGASQESDSNRYASGAGGGGWYGGGRNNGNYYFSVMNQLCGGGSGFVNTAANAGNRPSGYTGLQLDSGETRDGTTSFPSTSGGTEVGHSGHGYARLTRLS